jgi:hypothetical protein
MVVDYPRVDLAELRGDRRDVVTFGHRSAYAAKIASELLV